MEGLWNFEWFGTANPVFLATRLLFGQVSIFVFVGLHPLVLNIMRFREFVVSEPQVCAKRLTIKYWNEKYSDIAHLAIFYGT